jgi:hypothetical protein
MALPRNYLGNTRDMRGNPFVPQFQAPRRPYNPRYGASVSEIMSQRGNNTGAYDTQGQMLPAGTVLQTQGWNTSGVGPGTKGYRGSYANGGYNYGEGTRRPSALNSDQFYGQSGEGLNEFYRMQQGMSDWDRMQGRKDMDQTDAVGSQLASAQRAAAQRGDLSTAEMYGAALSDRLAQRMAGGGGQPFSSAQSGGNPWAGRTTYGDPGAFAAPQSPTRPMHSWEEQAMRRAAIQGDQFGPQFDPDSPEVQAMLDQAALDGRRPLQMGESASIGTNTGAPSIFTNAQGSVGPGGTRSVYGGTQSGPEFFQQSADRQGQANRFASPTDFNRAPTGMSLSDYSDRLMSVKQKLGKK